MAVQCSTETMAEKKEYKSVIRPRAHAQGKNTVQTSDSGARKLTTELPEVIYKQRPGNKGSQCLECRNGMIQIGSIVHPRWSATHGGFSVRMATYVPPQTAEKAGNKGRHTLLLP